MSQQTKPTLEQRIMSQLASQRNQALDTLSGVIAELQATQENLAEAQQLIAKLQSGEGNEVATKN